MPDVTIDWLGIVVATVASMVISGVWYGPLLGERWRAYIGKTREQLRAYSSMGMLVALLGSFLNALVMTYFTQWAGARSFAEGTAVGAVAWLGYLVPRRVTGGALEGQSWGHIMLDSGNALLSFMVVGGIVGAFA